MEMIYDGKTGLAEKVLSQFAPSQAPARAKPRFQVPLTLFANATG